MKYIIAGQLLLWGNLATIFAGYFLLQSLHIDSSFVHGLVGFIGVCSATANIWFAFLIQARGYRTIGIEVNPDTLITKSH